MFKNKNVAILFLLNTSVTMISIAFLIYGKFESSYGLELLGLQISIITLIVSKKDKKLEDYYYIIKKYTIFFIIFNGILDVIYIINAIITYPHFFWWQNFS